jgi:hypothetical protein
LHIAFAKTASEVAHIERPLLGKITSASTPSAARSRSRSSGSAPALERIRSSLNFDSRSFAAGSLHHAPAPPFASTSTRGSGLVLRVDPLAPQGRGSFACVSAETTKYLFGSPRARCAQPALPGVAVRQAFGSVTGELMASSTG